MPQHARKPATAAAEPVDAAGVAPSPAASPWPPELLGVAAEAADLGLFELDLATRGMRVSDSLRRLIGDEGVVPLDGLKALEERLFPEDVAIFRESFAQAPARGRLHCEVRVRRSDGRIGWISLDGTVVADGRRHAGSLAGVVQDITDRKSTEGFRQERESQFSAMFDASSVGMGLVDAVSGRLLRVNARLARSLRHSPDQLVGRRMSLLAHPDERARLDAEIARVVDGAIPALQTEARLLCRGGGMVWVLLTASLIRDASGTPLRVAMVMVDITTRKQAEQFLQDREEQLRSAHEMLERRVDERTAELAEANLSLQVEIAERRMAEQRVRELLGRQVQAIEEERSRISRELHDTLGQHLAALSIELKSIAEQPPGSTPLRQRVVKLQKSVRLIEDELDRLSYELRPLALDDLGLEEALRTHVQNWSGETGVPVELHTHGLRTGRLPPLVETTVYRVAQEALTNVRKHAQASRVGLIVERRAGELRVVVDDDGRGFDSAAVNSQGGRHLGLRGMNERALLIGASLEIESVPGRGTTVYLVIPLQADGEANAAR
jgi:two-component system sensor histidine kinase UhpB